MVKICISSDHGGYELKNKIINLLNNFGYEVKDLGSKEYSPDDDYPDTTKNVAEAISQGVYDRGIVLCGSGVGASVVANKFINVRAAICHDTYSATQGVEHDDMNVLCLGGRIIGEELANKIVEAFVNAEYKPEKRFQRRKEKLQQIEKNNFS